MQILIQKNWDGDWESVLLCSYFEKQDSQRCKMNKTQAPLLKSAKIWRATMHPVSPVASRVLYKQTTLEDSHSHPGFYGGVFTLNEE